MKSFPTDITSILQRIDEINPIEYGKSRNYLNGAISYLSPYISRGVISTHLILKKILEKGYEIEMIESFVKELCWRDYFQSVWLYKDVNFDLREPQQKVENESISKAIIEANLSIEILNSEIKKLYQTGYLHNHSRMYLAALACNIAHSHWKKPAQWMYYYLLDGDWASNACSWQWVAGANSTKKYVANQENINHYTLTHQNNTFLDCTYEELAILKTPIELQETFHVDLTTILPISDFKGIDNSKPTLLYNYYNLDPFWYQNQDCNRILLIEPQIFKQYPISEKCVSFMLSLSKNIKNIQVFVGEFSQLKQHIGNSQIIYKEHPLNKNYIGIEESRDWIWKAAIFYPSFFSYWKKASKYLEFYAKFIR